MNEILRGINMVDLDEKIICAAIYYNDYTKHQHQPTNINTGFVICGYRHCSILSTAYVLCVGKHLEKVEGFLTNRNRFLDRADAKIVAIQSGQIKETKFNELYSEDLY